jgi:hypothetical protein
MPKTVQLTEIPFPQMADALLQDRLDAVWAVEPVLHDPEEVRQCSRDRLSVSGKHPEHGHHRRCSPRRAGSRPMPMRQSVSAPCSHARRNSWPEAPKEERDAFVSKFTSVRPELVAEMSLPIFVSDFNVQSLKTNMELAVGQKLMKSIDVESMVWKG